jgi:GH25 family lysozyme M1 (1,4-beta-N-acetylmuramidase)
MPARGSRRVVPVLSLIASVGLAGLTATPAAAAASRTAAPASNAPATGRFNVGATHSPELLRQLAGPASPPGIVRSGPGPVITTVPAALPGAAQGVDVASYQHPKSARYPNGAPIGWPQVYGDGIRFAAVKVTEGAYYANSWALQDLPQAQAAGLTAVAYAFAIPNGGSSGSTKYSASPVVQADDLINYLKSHGVAVPAVMLDIEYDPYASQDGTNQCYGLSKPAMVSWIAGFSAEVRARTGRLPLIYTPPGWWGTCAGASTAFGQTPVWVPDYGNSRSPTLPAGWRTWNIWQYTSSGTVTGIQAPGATDLDQLNPGVITMLNAGDRKTTAGSPALASQVTPFTAGATPSLTYTAAGLPPGLAMAAATGQLSGWPDAPGTYHVTMTATSGDGTAGAAPFTWAVTAAATSGPAGPVRLALGGKCLNDTGNSPANGTRATIWACNGSAAQNWTAVQDDTLRIHGKCLDVYHGGTASGTPVDLYTCTGAGAQHWLTVTRGQLMNPRSGLCLSDLAGSTTNGTRLQLGPCAGNAYQKWTLPAGPVVSQLPGKCLADPGNRTASGTKLTIYSCDGTPSQAWSVRPDGTIQIHGKCLDVYHGGTASGTPVDLYPCNRTAAQQWRLSPAGAGVRLVNPHSGLPVIVTGTATANGTPLALAPVSGSPRELWRVK